MRGARGDNTAMFLAAFLAAVAAGDGNGLAKAVGAGCGECHPSIVARYGSGPMANALGEVDPAVLEGLEEIGHPDGAFSWRFAVEGGKAVLAESWRDPGTVGSEPVSTGASPLLFAIGAGLQDRSFAVRRGELVWFAPLEAMRTRDTGEWYASLAPGHAINADLRYDVPIASECLRCHTDAPPPAAYPGNVAPPATWTPRGIGCGACHSDADAHAQWQREARGNAQDGGSATRGDRVTEGGAGVAARHPGDPLLPPEPDDPIASVSTCARCHLQGDAHIAIAEPWHGIPPPGRDLLATRAVFVAAEPTDEIGFVSQVQRMVLSRCFTESLAANTAADPDHPRRALTCTTCHDPHAGGYDSARDARPRAACTLCHPSGEARAARRAAACARPLAERPGNDCVGCHMRTTGVFDLADVVIHDHRIVRVPPPPSERKPLRSKETQDARLAAFTWPGRPAPAWSADPGVWAMAWAALGDDARALEAAGHEPGGIAARMATFHHVRGSAFERAGRTKAAIEAYERALALDPDQGETSVNLGALLGTTGDAKRALEVLTAAIESHPQAEGALRNRAIVRLKSGDAAGFAADLDAAFRIHPQAAVARSLAQFWNAHGSKSLGEAWAKMARELDPAMPR